MALIHAAFTFFALCFFLLAQFCLGALLLRKLRFEVEPFAEFFLISAATGVVTCEIAISLVQWTQHIRVGCIFLGFLSLLPIGVELPGLWPKIKAAYHRSTPFTRHERLAFCSVCAVLLIEFLASLAPVTGSDALHYHFTVQKLLLEQGFHPIFFLDHSFLCGQSHLLILLGLALGSEQMATGLIFLGGALSALAVACLSARWAPRSYALLFTVVFLVTPVVFWQMCTSGSPDIWMAVYVGAASLALSGAWGKVSWRHAALAGFLSGGAAGAKYTGCFFAVALALALFVESRSALKTGIFFLTALCSGIWPYLRNFAWTSDPFFPFLTKMLFPERLNAYSLAMLHADTGVTSTLHVAGAFTFLTFTGRQSGNAPAFWEFYGPIVLALFPLVVIAFRNDREWRVRLIVWLISGISIFGASGLTRFTLPLFPIALSCVAAGLFHASSKGWWQTRRLAEVSAVVFGLLGGGGLLLYSEPALLAAVGIQSREAYLGARAPDYKIASAIDRSLGVSPPGGKTVVFFRHLYYLRSSYVLGDPDGSWSINPDLLKTPADFRSFFRQEGISYVVRAPAYPAVIAAPLLQMERDGSLIPYSETIVDNFRGNRISGERQEVSVFIFQVNPAFREAPTARVP